VFGLSLVIDGMEEMMGTSIFAPSVRAWDGLRVQKSV